MYKKSIFFNWAIGVISILFGCESISSQADSKESTNQEYLIIEEQKDQIKELKKQNVDLLTKLDNQKLDFTNAKEEIGYYKQFIQDALEKMSDEELLELAKKQWNYNFEVNEHSIPRNGKLAVQEDAIVVSLTEKQTSYNVLPNDFHSLGAISGNYEDHIQNLTPIPVETNWLDGTITTAIQYKFLDVKSGTTIKFAITDELKEKLELDTNQITIVKN